MFEWKNSGGRPAAGVLAIVALLLCGSFPAEANLSVRSVLEIRRERVMMQKWDLSCGAAALGTLLRYQFGEPVSEKEIARALMNRDEYVERPDLVKLREGFSLLDLKRYVEAYGARSVRPRRVASRSRKRSMQASARTVSIYKGDGLGQLDLSDLIERAPIIVPINALGYNHFVVFRGVIGNRVLLADPAWGNRTMTIDKFQRAWIDYGEPMGHIGFAVERADRRKLPNRLEPKPSDFVMLQ
jgi:predicted double-glycine peptidase